MGRKDQHALIFHIGEIHQHIVEKFLAGIFPHLLTHKIAIIQSRFIAMMAIGNKERFLIQQTFCLINNVKIGHPPQPVLHTVIISHAQIWLAAADIAG